MKKYRIRRNVIEEKCIEQIICNRCEKEIKTTGMFDLYYFNFEMRIGAVYPEGGSYEETTFDLCKNCAGIFVELLKEKGFNPHVEEISV